MMEVSRKDFEEIMSQSIRLKQCVKCLHSGEIKIKIPFFGATGAYVQCTKCGHSTRLCRIHACYSANDDTGSFGTPTTEMSMIKGIKQAIEEWNNPELQKIKTALEGCGL